MSPQKWIERRDSLEQRKKEILIEKEEIRKEISEKLTSLKEKKILDSRGE